MELFSRHARANALVAGLAVLSVCPWQAVAAPSGAPQASQGSQAGQITVKGVVSDATGEPLIGATILVKGTSKGTATDLDGNYTITAAPNSELQFSYIGYKSQTVKINGKTTLDVVLQEDSEVLDEVVVVGYGTQKKESMTGAVSVVDSKMLNEKGNLSSPAQAIQGQVPGVIVTRSSSAPAPRAGT